MLIGQMFLSLYCAISSEIQTMYMDSGQFLCGDDCQHRKIDLIFEFIFWVVAFSLFPVLCLYSCMASRHAMLHFNTRIASNGCILAKNRALPHISQEAISHGLKFSKSDLAKLSVEVGSSGKQSRLSRSYLKYGTFLILAIDLARVH